MDKISYTYPSGKKEILYRDACHVCKKDKGYVKKHRLGILCQECSGKKVGTSNLGKVGPNKGITFSEETRTKMSLAKKGKTPWNKGVKVTSKHTLDKMRSVRLGKSPINKGALMTEEQKIKLSCSVQNIPIEDFSGFKTLPNKKDRSKVADLGIRDACFARDLHTCQSCKINGVTLHAHHKNSFAFFPEQRLNVDNLITLCFHCHEMFHGMYGNGKAKANTAEQMEEFLKIMETFSKKEVYLVVGPPASGKSWVCNQLKDKYSYVSHDSVSKKMILRSIVAADKPPLYDPVIGISTFIKETSNLLTIKLIVIDELQEVIEQRMQARGGKITPTIKRRIKRMQAFKKQAIFSGTSNEVLDFLKSL